jgi:hypothetical protein
MMKNVRKKLWGNFWNRRGKRERESKREGVRERESKRERVSEREKEREGK